MGTSHSRITLPFFGVLLCAPVTAQVTQRVSLRTGGAEANYDSYRCSISADGRFVAFESASSNLVVPPDTYGFQYTDIFVRDRQLGTTERISVASDGTQGNGYSLYPSISADGRFVAFMSRANNLVPGDTNNYADIFVRDRQLGTTERVNVASNGTQTDQFDSERCSISADGRYVAFDTTADNLVPGDTGTRDVFVHDRQSGTTECVSVNSDEMRGNDNSVYSSISADGRFVAFASVATNLDPADHSAIEDVFVRDRQLGTTELMSVRVGGGGGNAFSWSPSISADGRYVAYSSDASNLVPWDPNGHTDIFIRDRDLGTTGITSIDSGGVPGNDDAFLSSISADGRYVAFVSDADNLVPGGSGGIHDVFVHDRQTGTTELINVDSSGAHGNGSVGGVSPFGPSISADGRYVVFENTATNLVPGDANGWADIFVRDRIGGTTFTSLCDPGVGGVQACPCSNPPAGPGRGCNNSAATGGASLSASGGTYLSSDSLVFTTSGEKPTALSTVWQGPATPAAGLVYGQGVRCVNGSLKRLYSKAAVGGSITAPNFGAGDLTVSARSAALGVPIQPGTQRYYFVSYRDPSVLGGCPAGSTFNATQTGMVGWSP